MQFGQSKAATGGGTNAAGTRPAARHSETEAPQGGIAPVPPLPDLRSERGLYSLPQSHSTLSGSPAPGQGFLLPATRPQRRSLHPESPRALRSEHLARRPTYRVRPRQYGSHVFSPAPARNRSEYLLPP